MNKRATLNEFFCAHFLSLKFSHHFKKAAFIISQVLTHYSTVLLFYTPENIRKPLRFLTFSGGIEKQHRAVRG